MILLLALLPLVNLISVFAIDQSKQPDDAVQTVDFIDSSIENGSPLWYEVVNNVLQINLIYDHERASPNRAAGHIHFVLHAIAGASLTLEFRNLDNVWNGQPGSVAGELKSVAISEDGKTWNTVPTESLPGNRVQLRSAGWSARSHPAGRRTWRWSCTTTATACCTSAVRRWRNSIGISRA